MKGPLLYIVATLDSVIGERPKESISPTKSWEYDLGIGTTIDL